nr:nitroreductase family protein [Acidithiobacillus ferrooxidans]
MLSPPFHQPDLAITLDNTNRSVLCLGALKILGRPVWTLLLQSKNGRAVKAFDPHHAMPEETRHVLLKTAILSPSAYNIQNWRVVDVRDSAQRAAIPMNSNVKKH